MQNLGIVTTLVYSGPSILRGQVILRNLSNMQDRLFPTEPCVTLVYSELKTFRTLSNIYDGKFYSQPCVTLLYLEPWYTQNPRHIRNTTKHLSRNILFKTFCNPGIFRTLSIFKTRVYSEIKAYSEPCRISKKERVTIADLEAEYIQNCRVPATP